MRAIQDLRKKQGLMPGDRIALAIKTSGEGKRVLEERKAEIMRTTGADDLVLEETKGASILIEGMEYVIALKKR